MQKNFINCDSNITAANMKHDPYLHMVPTCIAIWHQVKNAPHTPLVHRKFEHHLGPT